MRAKHSEWFLKTEEGTLAPSCPDAEASIAKIEVGHYVPMKIIDDPSPAEFSAIFAFLRFVYDNQDTYSNFNEFRDDIKLGIGWGNFISHEYKGEYIRTFLPKSWKWADITQDEWHTIAENVKDYVMSEYGISFNDWFDKRFDYEVCATPFCFKKAELEHHIFPGTARRELCDKHGLVVRICHTCHQKAHLLHYLRYVRYYCRIVGYDDWMDAFKLINTGDENEKMLEM